MRICSFKDVKSVVANFGGIMAKMSGGARVNGVSNKSVKDLTELFRERRKKMRGLEASKTMEGLKKMKK